MFDDGDESVVGLEPAFLQRSISAPPIAENVSFAWLPQVSGTANAADLPAPSTLNPRVGKLVQQQPGAHPRSLAELIQQDFPQTPSPLFGTGEERRQGAAPPTEDVDGVALHLDKMVDPLS